MLLQTYLSVNKDLNFSVFRTDVASADLGNIGYIQTVSYNIICGHQGADVNMRVLNVHSLYTLAFKFAITCPLCIRNAGTDRTFYATR